MTHFSVLVDRNGPFANNSTTIDAESSPLTLIIYLPLKNIFAYMLHDHEFSTSAKFTIIEKIENDSIEKIPSIVDSHKLFILMVFTISITIRKQ